MYRCMSPGAIGIRLEWEACLPLAKQAGFEGIDVPVDPGTPASKYKDALAAHGLRPGGMGLPVNFREDQKTLEDGLPALDAVASRAAEIGVTRFSTWLLPFSDTLPLKENFRVHAERLSPAAGVLAAHGCVLGLEFLGPKTLRQGHRYPFIHTLEHMLELCDAVGDNVGLLLDSWHWYTSLGTVESIVALTPEQVVYVHINDAPAGISVDRQIDSVRCVPGETGVQDLAGFLSALRQIGYDGPVTPEPFVDELREMAPEAAARRVGDGLLRVWSQSA